MKKKVVKCVTSTPTRSIVKAITWELIAFIITLIVVYVAYGDIKESIKFSIILTIIKIFFLYFHERIWKKTMWGKVYAKKYSSI